MGRFLNVMLISSISMAEAQAMVEKDCSRYHSDI